jgi:hypothetical protein
MNARLEELLIAMEDDTISPADRAELELLLASNSTARRQLVEAGVLRNLAAAHEFDPANREQALSPSSRWRPILTMAAGIVIGCFSTTLLWGFSGAIRRVALPMSNPSFEQPEALPQVRLPASPDQWAGVDTSIVQGGGTLPVAKHGLRMIRNGPAPAGKGCFASLMLDLTQSRPVTGGPLQIEVTTHSHASKPGLNEHYSLHLATFAEEPAAVPAMWERTWKDIGEESLTVIGKAIFPTKDQPGWHPITLRIDVPPQARTLVIAMGSNTPGPVSGRTDHYMDDIRATWLILDSNNAQP